MKANAKAMSDVSDALVCRVRPLFHVISVAPFSFPFALEMGCLHMVKEDGEKGKIPPDDVG